MLRWQHHGRVYQGLNGTAGPDPAVASARIHIRAIQCHCIVEAGRACDPFHFLLLTVALDRFHTARIVRGIKHQHKIAPQPHLIRARVPGMFPCAVKSKYKTGSAGHFPARPSALTRKDPGLLGKNDPLALSASAPEAEWTHTVNIVGLARAKRFRVRLDGNLDTSAHPLGANGANFGARQAFHAFGVDDVDHCSELCSESCSKSCSQCGSLYPSTSGSFFVSAED